VSNAVDQANREVGTRFDFKGSDAKFELKEFVITLHAKAEFQLKQMLDILFLKLSKRGIDVSCTKLDDPVVLGQTAKQVVTLRQGIETELGKKLQRLIKDSKLKVQAAIQDKQVRVTGKSRDDLQEVMRLARNAKLDMPLQFTNFRD
jgi:uncharacterized protein YajQ (UPF0234 family)